MLRLTPYTLKMIHGICPENYREKFYPEESEMVLVEKINELLEILHKGNPKIKTKFLDEFL